MKLVLFYSWLRMPFGTHSQKSANVQQHTENVWKTAGVTWIRPKAAGSFIKDKSRSRTRSRPNRKMGSGCVEAAGKESFVLIGVQGVFLFFPPSFVLQHESRASESRLKSHHRMWCSRTVTLLHKYLSVTLDVKSSYPYRLFLNIEQWWRKEKIVLKKSAFTLTKVYWLFP